MTKLKTSRLGWRQGSADQPTTTDGSISFTYVLNGLVDFLHALLAALRGGRRIGVLLDRLGGDLDVVSVKLHVVDLKKKKEEC